MKKIKAFYHQFKVYINYLISACASFLIDIFFFTLIFLFIENKTEHAILIASFTARAISSVFNYLINKNKVFNSQDKSSSSAIQYFLLVILNISLSSILVERLSHIIHIFASLIKLIVECLIFIMNFYIQKLFIFNDHKKDSKFMKVFIACATFIAIFLRINQNNNLILYPTLAYLLIIPILPLLIYLYLKVFKQQDKLWINITSIIIAVIILIIYNSIELGKFYALFQNDILILLNTIKFICLYNLLKNTLNLLPTLS